MSKCQPSGLAILSHIIALVIGLTTFSRAASSSSLDNQSKTITQQSRTSKQITVSRISMDQYPGGSVKTDLGHDIILNKTSSLTREWFVVNDSNAPVKIVGAAGIKVTHAGKYRYEVSYTLESKEPVTAFEIRVHVVDPFGKLIRTLTATELMDFSGSISNKGQWIIWTENEASEAFASVVYIAQIRTTAGKVYEIDRNAVFDQISKIGKKLTEADLEPKRETPQN